MSTFAEELVAIVQSVAIAHAALRCTDNALADFVIKAMERDFSQSELDDVRRLLHSQPLRAALASRDVALWTGADGLLRLVDQQPSSRKAALLRTAHHPGPTACRFCLMRETRNQELQPDRDAQGAAVAGSFVHPRCANAWARLKNQAASRTDSG